MRYSIKIRRTAQSSLARISQPYQNRIIEAIKALEIEPRPVGCKKLSGREAWRIRAGDYRVIYEIQEPEHVIIVVVVGHRSQVFKVKS
jgi:mRNA interferase RelE/StbE